MKNKNNLTPFVDEITQIIIQVALEHYGKKIAIIAMYGSRAIGTSTDRSDLEFYAIVDDDTKVDIEFTFQQIPVDIWSQNWERIESISRADQYWVLPAGSIANSKIVYNRSDKDLIRFLKIRDQIEKSKSYRGKHLKFAHDTYKQMYGSLGMVQFAKHHEDLQEARDAMWNLIIGYTLVVAHINGEYLKNNWGKSLEEIFDMPYQASQAKELITEMVVETDLENLLKLSTDFVEVVRQYMIDQTKDDIHDTKTSKPELEMLSNSDSLAYLNKMMKAADNKNIYAAGYAVHDFQPLVARDIIKLQGNWNESNKYLLYNEYSTEYLKEYPDFNTALDKSLDKSTMLVKLHNLALSSYDKLIHENTKINKIKNFESLEKLRSFFILLPENTTDIVED